MGLQAVTTLLSCGANLILGVRDVAEGERVASAAVATAGGRGTTCVLPLDLSRLSSVRAFARHVASLGVAWDGLLNCAGVFGVRGVTPDGYQTVWQTNAMAPALLTELLLPVAGVDARVVNVGSKLYRLACTKVGAACPPTSPGDGYADYALSKAAQVLHSVLLSSRFAGTPRRAFTVEPGLVATGIMRQSSWVVRTVNYALLTPILRDADQGTASALLCLLAPEPLLPAGCYVVDCGAEAPAGDCGRGDEAEEVGGVFRAAWGQGE